MNALVPDSTIRSRTSKIKKTKTEYAEYFLKFPLNKLDLNASVPSFFHLVIITAASVGVAKSPPPPIHLILFSYSYLNYFEFIVSSLRNDICSKLHSDGNIMNLCSVNTKNIVAQHTAQTSIYLLVV